MLQAWITSCGDVQGGHQECTPRHVSSRRNSFLSFQPPQPRLAQGIKDLSTVWECLQRNWFQIDEQRKPDHQSEKYQSRPRSWKKRPLPSSATWKWGRPAAMMVVQTSYWSLAQCSVSGEGRDGHCGKAGGTIALLIIARRAPGPRINSLPHTRTSAIVRNCLWRRIAAGRLGSSDFHCPTRR